MSNPSADGPQAKGRSLWVTSLYGYNSQQPLVAITMPGGESVQLSVSDAREHALAVLECAEAAEGDGFVIEFIRKLGKSAGTENRLSEQMIAGLVNEFRLYREANREKG